MCVSRFDCQDWIRLLWAPHCYKWISPFKWLSHSKGRFWSWSACPEPFLSGHSNDTLLWADKQGGVVAQKKHLYRVGLKPQGWKTCARFQKILCDESCSTIWANLQQLQHHHRPDIQISREAMPDVSWAMCSPLSIQQLNHWKTLSSSSCTVQNLPSSVQYDQGVVHPFSSWQMPWTLSAGRATWGYQHEIETCLDKEV